MNRALPALALPAFALAAALAAPAARAQSGPREPVRLRWVAPAGCPDRDGVLAEVARLIRRAPDTPRDEAFSADGEVSCAPGRGCAIDLETVSPAGSARRVFDGANCAEVSSAAALIIALALEPDFAADVDGIDAERPPRPAGSEDPLPVTHAHPHAERDPRGHEPPAPEDRPRPTFRAGTGVDVGSLPSPTPTAQAAIGMLLGPLRVELAGTYLSPQRWVLRPSDGAGIDVLLFEIEARACGRVTHGRLEYGACGAAGAGSMHGRAVGVSSPTAERGSPWVAVLAGSFATVRMLPWLEAHLAVELGLAVMSPRFEVSTPNGTMGFGPPTVFGRATLSMEVRLP